jgi:hypothetical protein
MPRKRKFIAVAIAPEVHARLLAYHASIKPEKEPEKPRRLTPLRTDGRSLSDTISDLLAKVEVRQKQTRNYRASLKSKATAVPDVILLTDDDQPLRSVVNGQVLHPIDQGEAEQALILDQIERQYP